MKELLKIFDTFYDDNENGGSSRWLVSPDTVRRFIINIIKKYEYINSTSNR